MIDLMWYLFFFLLILSVLFRSTPCLIHHALGDTLGRDALITIIDDPFIEK